MPLMWLTAHTETMRELQAEECLRDSEVISVGSGRLKRPEHDKAVRRWRGQLGQEDAVRVHRGMNLSRLEAMGIKVRHEPR